MSDQRRTKIIATVGPASASVEALVAMTEAGMDVARLNFAHGTTAEHAAMAEAVREAARRAGRRVAILQDLPGPKLRIGPVADGVVILEPGARLMLAAGSTEPGDQRRLPVPCRDLAAAVDDGDVVYVADGSVRLRVTSVSVEAGEVHALVELGGAVGSHQGVNLPRAGLAWPAVGERDLEWLRFGESIGVDLVALSFVRSPEDITGLRAHTGAPLIAKIENPAAVERAEEIIAAADGVMVARGDLGIELPIEDIPHVQKRLICLAGAGARPVITATQMLESMVLSKRPTRAEVTDVANAILDGTDAVMLSQETAVGANPVGAVEMMAAIARRTELEAPFEHWAEARVSRQPRSLQEPAHTLAYNACAAAHQLELAALIVPTLTGHSARLVSAHRPPVPIYALSPDERAARRCAALWGVEAAVIAYQGTTEALIAASITRVLELGWVAPGQRVGITAGLPSGGRGTTSLLQVQRAGAAAPQKAPATVAAAG